MGREEKFDSFYRATRDALVHQAFALTGDLPAAQNAVRDAYVMAWQHWRKASSFDDPLDWVRPRAWRLAQRRHTGRLWHRNKDISEHDEAVLDALGKLSSLPRRVLLLTQLATVPLGEAARELAVTREDAERHLQTGTANFAANLNVDSTIVRAHLESLSGAAGAAALPRASIVRRAGRKRGQAHTLLAIAAAVAITVTSGAFVTQGENDEQTETTDAAEPERQPAVSTPVDDGLPHADALLDSDQIRRLGMAQSWRIRDTSNNTAGDGINTICQGSRFADPDGLAALVRIYQARGNPRRRVVQSVEISRSGAEAKKAFATTVGWYAGCQVARLQLLQAYQANGIGDDAHVLVLRVLDNPATSYSVGVARTGRITTTTVSKTVDAAAPPPVQIVQSLADSVAMLCKTNGSLTCAKNAEFTPVPPPPSGEQRGILAVADLPPVGRVDQPWVGTRPVPARRNPTATSCDRADFASTGAVRTRTRTFLIPQANLAPRFGLAETYGSFRTDRAARNFLRNVRSSVASCEDRDLATTVSDVSVPRTVAGMDLSIWDLRTEISDNEAVRFRVGFVRVGSAVAQITFAPTSRNDISDTGFVDLLVRAGERLRELP